MVSAIRGLKKSCAMNASINDLWDTRYEEDKYSLRATNSMKVNGFEISSLAGQFNHIEYVWGAYYSIDFPIESNSQHSLHFNLCFFLYQFQLAIDFVTDWEESLFRILCGLYKNGIACGYCILCITMPRINWLFILLAFSLFTKSILLQFSSLHFSLIHCGQLLFASPHL